MVRWRPLQWVFVGRMGHRPPCWVCLGFCLTVLILWDHSAASAEMYALLNTIVVKDLNDAEEDLRRKKY